MRNHTCSAYCVDEVHADLIYTNISTPAVVGRYVAEAESVEIVSIEPAYEAPTFKHAERMGLAIRSRARYTSAPMTDQYRHLVRWREQA